MGSKRSGVKMKMLKDFFNEFPVHFMKKFLDFTNHCSKE